jgi:hypothetical protein
MITRRSTAAIVVGATLVATSLAALAQQDDDDEPKKGGRLSLSVTQVGTKVPIQQPIRITSRASWSGGRADFSYSWSSVSGTPLPSGIDVSSDSLDFPANSLAPGGSYHLRLDVVATTEQGLQTKAAREIKFKGNEPPRGGSCKVSTKALGAAGALQITLSAPGWTDPDGQVQYRFEVLRGKQVLAVQNWKAFTSFTTALRPKQGDVLLGRCGIRDEVGDGTTLETAHFDGSGSG